MIVVYSKEDIAGCNIAKYVKEYTETFSVNSPLLYCEKEIENIGADYIIFASKHKSESGKPCFTVHTPGNFGKAEYGGKDNEVCIACPNEMKTIIMNIANHTEIKKLNFDVCMEVTHHGPYIKVPCFFVEIGSSEREWKNELAAKIVGDAIITHTFKPYKWPIAVGIGGTHYCPKFTKYELHGATEGNAYAFSHVIPNYSIENIDLKMLKKTIDASKEKVKEILMDWKGLKKDDREKIMGLLKEIEIKFRRV